MLVNCWQARSQRRRHPARHGRGTAERFEEFVAFHDERVERAAKKPDFIRR